jgi:signal transduction histidine kinase
VFVNLLTNAARYTGNGGRIVVMAEREYDRAVSEGIPSRSQRGNPQRRRLGHSESV